MTESAPPPLPSLSNGSRYALAGAGIVALLASIAISQAVAASEVRLARDFVERVNRGDPSAATLATPLVAQALVAVPAPGVIEVLRRAHGFHGEGANSVGWGTRCVTIDAVGTEVTTVWIDVVEDDAGEFRIAALELDRPTAGPCSSD